MQRLAIVLFDIRGSLKRLSIRRGGGRRLLTSNRCLFVVFQFVFSALFLALLSENNLAVASTSDGKVIDYWVHNTHDSFAFSVENQIGRPSCASYGSPFGRYVVDTRTDRGKAIVSSVIAAKASGQKIRVGGANTCTYYGDSEDTIWVHVY